MIEKRTQPETVPRMALQGVNSLQQKQQSMSKLVEISK